MLASTEVCRYVSGQPLHDDVVGPVHGEVSDIDGPQRPVVEEVTPARIAVGNLGGEMVVGGNGNCE